MPVIVGIYNIKNVCIKIVRVNYYDGTIEILTDVKWLSIVHSAHWQLGHGCRLITGQTAAAAARPGSPGDQAGRCNSFCLHNSESSHGRPASSRCNGGWGWGRYHSWLPNTNASIGLDGSTFRCSYLVLPG